MYEEIPNTYWDENKQTGWYQYDYPNDKTLYSYNFIRKYCDIVYWIQENIPMHYRHTRWTADEERIRVRFRYERDFIMFTLRWS
jgi:hypothetical protein